MSKGWQCYTPSGDVAEDLVTDFERSVIPLVKDLTPGRRALDVGCGNGRHCNVLCNYFDRVLGIDNTYRSTLLPNYGVGFSSVDFFDLEESGFDLVLFWGAFYIMKKYQEAIDKTHSILNEGGIVVIADDPRRRIDRADGENHSDGLNYNISELIPGKFEELNVHYRVTILRAV